MTRISRRSLLAALAAAVLAAGAAACGSSAAPVSGGSPPAAPSPSARYSVPPPAVPSAEVIARDMDLRHVTAYTAATDPNQLLGREHGYTSKVNWRRNGKDCTASGVPGVGQICTPWRKDNSIEVFRTVADREARQEYVSGFQCPFGDSYDYGAATALLRLGCEYTPAQAHRLRAAFYKAVFG